MSVVPFRNFLESVQDYVGDEKNVKILAFSFAGIAGSVFLVKKIQKMKEMQKRRKWMEESKHKVILHQYMRAKNVPNLSPFCLKLETYLRMANIINYEVDETIIFGPNGQSPWVTVDGKEMADSQLIIEYLGEKNNKNFSKNYDDKSIAAAEACRIICEEHIFFGFLKERFGYLDFSKILKISGCDLWKFNMCVKPHYMKISYTQGMGRHSREEVQKLIRKDLKYISDVLGNNKFLVGNEPIESDCGVFGMLAQMIWCAPGSQYPDMIKNDFPKLYEYCLRMKEQFYPDWDQLCNK